jgi:hypothetical protein
MRFGLLLLAGFSVLDTPFPFCGMIAIASGICPCVFLSNRIDFRGK